MRVCVCVYVCVCHDSHVATPTHLRTPNTTMGRLYWIVSDTHTQAHTHTHTHTHTNTHRHTTTSEYDNYSGKKHTQHRQAHTQTQMHTNTHGLLYGLYTCMRTNVHVPAGVFAYVLARALRLVCMHVHVHAGVFAKWKYKAQHPLATQASSTGQLSQSAAQTAMSVDRNGSVGPNQRQPYVEQWARTGQHAQHAQQGQGQPAQHAQQNAGNMTLSPQQSQSGISQQDESQVRVQCVCVCVCVCVSVCVCATAVLACAHCRGHAQWPLWLLQSSLLRRRASRGAQYWLAETRWSLPLCL